MGDVNAPPPRPAGDANRPTVAQMLACARRELAMRRMVYPRRLSSGKMTVNEARFELACMEEIVVLLERRAGVGRTGELEL